MGQCLWWIAKWRIREYVGPYLGAIILVVGVGPSGTVGFLQQLQRGVKEVGRLSLAQKVQS